MRPLTAADIPALLELWRQFYPRRYWVNDLDLRRQVFGSLLYQPDLSHGVFEGDRCIAFAAIKRPFYAGAEDRPWHVSAGAWLDDEAWTNLLKASEQETLVFGMDHDHLFPGVPKEIEARLNTWTLRGEHFDLERDLDTFSFDPRVLAPLLTEGMTVRPGAHSDAEAVDAFLHETFPGRWHHDVMRKFLQEPHEIDVLMQQRVCHGFSFTQSPVSSHHIGGAIWRHSLGDNWRSLGPIGISRQARGKGLGNALLVSSLKRLAESGGRHTIIDWTTLDEFYQAQGFEITRRYRWATWRAQS